MGTSVGELFVSLGVKGGDKTQSTISGVQKGLKDTATFSLEAKAAIVGAMYALERLFAASGQTGTNLTNFGAILGTGTQTLQQYQYAARQVGVTNEALEGTFKSLAATSTKILRGETKPTGLAQVSRRTGLTFEEIKQSQSNPEILLQRLQQYAQLQKDIGLRNSDLKSFGLSDDIIAGLARNAFRPDVLKKAPVYKESEVQALDKANIAWSNLSTKIEMAFGHFNAKHGGEIVTQISKIVDEVTKLAEAFTKLAEKVKLFDKLTLVFTGWGHIFEGISEAVDAISEFADSQASLKEEGNPTVGQIEDNQKQSAKTSDRLLDAFMSGGSQDSLISILIDVLKEKAASAPKGEKNRQPPAAQTPAPRAGVVPSAYSGSVTPTVVRPTLQIVSPKTLAPVPPVISPKSIAPAVKPVESASNTKAPHVEIKQTFAFENSDGNPGNIGRAARNGTQDGVQRAFKQMGAQNQAT